MFRWIAAALILGGLIIAGIGLESVVSARRGEDEAAAEWERELAARPQLPAGRRRVPSTPKFELGEPIGRLAIARLKTDLYVVEGAGKKELRKGPGHLADTALPGAKGNCVIAGHRDTHFRVLMNVAIGETISLESMGRNFLYRVTDRRVISPTDTRSLNPTEKPSLTLVTCYPFYYVGPAPKRFIVRAELIQQRASTSPKIFAFNRSSVGQ